MPTTAKPARRTRRTDADTAAADTAAADDGGPVAADTEVTWTEAIVWLALQVGGRPSMPEVTSAMPVWAALNASPGVSARRMVADAEDHGVVLDAAAVERVLARFQRVGIARASVDGAVQRWSPVSPAEIVAGVKRAVTTAASGGDTVAARVTNGGGTALPAGALRAKVAAYMAEHPDVEMTPHATATALGASSGAVAKICDKLAAEGALRLTNSKPRTYQHAATGADGDPADDEQ